MGRPLGSVVGGVHRVKEVESCVVLPVMGRRSMGQGTQGELDVVSQGNMPQGAWDDYQGDHMD